MTELEAWSKIQALILERRRYGGISYSGYCSKCQNIDARYLTYSIVDGSRECEECFIKRKYSELATGNLATGNLATGNLAPQITEEDSSEIKAQRAQTVREYFRIRKCSETFTKKFHGL